MLVEISSQTSIPFFAAKDQCTIKDYKDKDCVYIIFGTIAQRAKKTKDERTVSYMTSMHPVSGLFTLICHTNIYF